MGQLDGYYGDTGLSIKETKSKKSRDILNLNTQWHTHLRVCFNCGYITIPWSKTIRCSQCGCSKPNSVIHIHYVDLLYKFGDKEIKKKIRDFRNKNDRTKI